LLANTWRLAYIYTEEMRRLIPWNEGEHIFDCGIWNVGYCMSRNASLSIILETCTPMTVLETFVKCNWVSRILAVSHLLTWSGLSPLHWARPTGFLLGLGIGLSWTFEPSFPLIEATWIPNSWDQGHLDMVNWLGWRGPNFCKEFV
jgi:hypothetical protein